MSRKGESSRPSKSAKSSKSNNSWTNDPQRVTKTSVNRRTAAESARNTPPFDFGSSDANVARVFQHLGSMAKSGSASSKAGQSSKRGGRRSGSSK